MDIISRLFHYDKAIVLNAIYDTLDSLGIIIKYSNSEEGEIIAQADSKIPIRLTLENTHTKELVNLTIFSTEKDPAFCDNFFDKISCHLYNAFLM